MAALVLSYVLFGAFAIVGLGFLSVFSPRLRPIQTYLIAPAVGVAVIIVPVFTLNRFGYPVKDFGRILIFSLIILSLLLIFIRKQNFYVKQISPFIILSLLATVLVGWPMIWYGFDWLSFINDDMANYSLSALRFYNYGYFEAVRAHDMLEGRDYTQVFWFMHIAAGQRAGSELLLATIWALTGLNAHQVFMPLMLSLHLAMVGAGASLLGNRGWRSRAPLVAFGLLIISPLSALGFLYQLIGQVSGLALLCALFTLTLSYRPLNGLISTAKYSVAGGFVFVALLIFYPELIPFFGIGWIAFIIVRAFHSPPHALNMVLLAIPVGLTALALTGPYAVTAILFLLDQTINGLNSSDYVRDLFPFFMIPSGIPTVWGLTPLISSTPEPYLSVAIASGIALFCFVAARSFALLRLDRGPIVVTSIMAAIALILFIKGGSFGLFKLAMYAQPFLLGSLVVVLLRWRRGPLAALILGAVAIPMLVTQLGYVQKGTGELQGGLNDVPHASSDHVNRQFQNFINTVSEDSVIQSTANSIVLAKLQSLYTVGRKLLFVSRDFYFGLREDQAERAKGDYSDSMQALLASIDQYETHSLGAATFRQLRSDLIGDNSVYVSVNPSLGIFNRQKADISDQYFLDVSDYQNFLIFVSSDIGSHYYLPESLPSGLTAPIAIYQSEPDPMFPTSRFAALGRNLMFEVLNPSELPRLAISLSSSGLPQFGSALPDVLTEGASIGFVGRGSGRIISPPLEPQWIGGRAYLSFDINRDPRKFPSTRTGLMRLYGQDVSEDSRLVTSFGRDISLLSAQEYESISPPASVQKFPDDLNNANLEYSGIYEDGWLSERSFVKLAPLAQSKFLVVKGAVPLIDDSAFNTRLVISVDGVDVVSEPLSLGEFEIKVPSSGMGGRLRVDLTFEKHQTLPGADGRIIGAQIGFIGFVDQ